MGQAGAAPVTIKAARAELQEAEDNLETLQSTLTMLDANLKAYEAASEWARQRLEFNISGVIRAEVDIPKLLAKYEALREQLGECRAVLLWLDRLPSVRPEDGVMFEHRGFEYRPAPAIDETACTAPWASAIQELAVNSDAPLPAV